VSKRMLYVVGFSAMLSWLLLTQISRAADVEEVPLDKLPPGIPERASMELKSGEIVAATRESEGDKKFYIVSVLYKGKKTDWYTVSSGAFWARKEDELSVNEVPGLFLASLLVSLLPGAIGAAAARFVIQRIRPDKSSIPLEWLAAWFGAGLVLGILWIAIDTLRPHSMTVVVLWFSIWGGLSACIVEVFVLTMQSIRGRGKSSRIWILAFCLTGVAFLGLSIPVANHQREWTNQYRRADALAHDRQE
jgi:hypothetical protein